jgi:hypothetical protein
MRHCWVSFVVLFLTSCANTPAVYSSSQTLTLYSWNRGWDRWRYVLVPDNAAGSHTAEQIMHSPGVVVGETALKARLASFPPGQKIEWLDDAPQHMLNWPPRRTMSAVVLFARRHHIDLKVFRTIYTNRT